MKLRIEPVVDRTEGTYRFEIRTGTPTNRAVIAKGTKEGRGGFRCLLTEVPIPFDYIRREGQHERFGCVMVAVVGEIARGRLFLPASRRSDPNSELSNTVWLS